MVVVGIAVDLGYLLIGLSATALGALSTESIIGILDARKSQRREVLEMECQAMEIARILGDKAWEARQAMHQAMTDARRQRS